MTVAALRWFKAALLLQLLLLGYVVAVEVVSLPPWNALAARPADYDLGGSIAIQALPLIVLMLLFASGIQAIATLAAIGYAGILAWQLWTWWKPFVLGADAAWQARYESIYASTVKILPVYGAHLPPDAQHIVLQLLILAALIATVGAVARMRHL